MNSPVKNPGKQIEVQIMGQSYLLSCPPGGESALLDAVERVDTAMCRIRDAGKVKARDRIAVLASLNLAFDLSQKESQLMQASQAVPPAAAPATPAVEPATDAGTLVDAATNARLQDLVRRLDQALGSDGQLL
jgi:cell division protein ZapA